MDMVKFSKISVKTSSVLHNFHHTVLVAVETTNFWQIFLKDEVFLKDELVVSDHYIVCLVLQI